MVGHLFRRGVDQRIQRNVSEDDVYEILKATHSGPYGGHFADKRIGYKVLYICMYVYMLLLLTCLYFFRNKK